MEKQIGYAWIKYQVSIPDGNFLLGELHVQRWKIRRYYEINCMQQQKKDWWQNLRVVKKALKTLDKSSSLHDILT